MPYGKRYGRSNKMDKGGSSIGDGYRKCPTDKSYASGTGNVVESRLNSKESYYAAGHGGKKSKMSYYK